MTEEERFERAIDAVLADRSPRRELTGLSDEHRRMLWFMQLLRGTRGQQPTPEFIERLHTRLFSAELRPLPPLPSMRTRVRGETVEVFSI